MPSLDRLISFVTPSQCLACGKEGPLLCLSCAAVTLPFVPEQCFKCRMPSKGSAICPSCIHQCSLQHVWSRTIYNGVAKQLIHDFKFARAQFAAPTIAAFMAEALPNVPRNTIVVPIPTATSRYRARGYDHAHLLAKALAKQTGLQFCPILSRLGQTRQVGASRTERKTQLKNAFRLTGTLPNNPSCQTGVPILLVDDVTTTGATLEAAALTLNTALTPNHLNPQFINAITFAYKLS